MTDRIEPTRNEPYLTVAEVAAIFKVIPKTVRRWIAEGSLEAIEKARIKRIHPDAVRRFAMTFRGARKRKR